MRAPRKASGTNGQALAHMQNADGNFLAITDRDARTVGTACRLPVGRHGASLRAHAMSGPIQRPRSAGDLLLTASPLRFRCLVALLGRRTCLDAQAGGQPHACRMPSGTCVQLRQSSRTQVRRHAFAFVAFQPTFRSRWRRELHLELMTGNASKFRFQAGAEMPKPGSTNYFRPRRFQVALRVLNM